MAEPSLIRLYLIRGLYLLLAFGLSVQLWPLLLGPIALEPFYESVVTAMLSTMALTSCIGVVAPLRMLPILLFEMTWKVTWLLSVALPRWLSGTLTEEFGSELFAMAMVLPFLLIFPWRYFIGQISSHQVRWR